MVWLAVLLAVLGAFCLAFGAQRQGSAVKADTGGLALSTHGLMRLARNPRWVFGFLLLCVGMAMNAVALVMAPLTVVQPIGAIALVITTVVNTKDQGLSMNRATVVAISACVTGSALFVVLAVNVTQENHNVSSEDELTIVLLLALAVGLFGTLALVFKHRMSAFVYILGAGVLFGFVAVLTRIIGRHLLDPNGLFLLNVPWYSGVAIIAAGVLAVVVCAERLFRRTAGSRDRRIDRDRPHRGHRDRHRDSGRTASGRPTRYGYCHGDGRIPCYRGSDSPVQAPPGSHQAQEGRAEGRGQVLGRQSRLRLQARRACADGHL